MVQKTMCVCGLFSDMVMTLNPDENGFAVAEIVMQVHSLFRNGLGGAHTLTFVPARSRPLPTH